MNARIRYIIRKLSTGSENAVAEDELMKNRSWILVGILLMGLLLTACSGSGEDAAAKTVESYLQALVGKDATKLSSLSCKDWEEQATLELDSFQAVDATLENLSCAVSSTESDTTLVKCAGSIVATYNNEKQSLDLSTKLYKVVQEGGDWRVCGYK